MGNMRNVDVREKHLSVVSPTLLNWGPSWQPKHIP